VSADATLVSTRSPSSGAGILVHAALRTPRMIKAAPWVVTDPPRRRRLLTTNVPSIPTPTRRPSGEPYHRFPAVCGARSIVAGTSPITIQTGRRRLHPGTATPGGPSGSCSCSTAHPTRASHTRPKSHPNILKSQCCQRVKFTRGCAEGRFGGVADGDSDLVRPERGTATGISRSTTAPPMAATVFPIQCHAREGGHPGPERQHPPAFAPLDPGLRRDDSG